jgi:hypothetical protein
MPWAQNSTLGPVSKLMEVARRGKKNLTKKFSESDNFAGNDSFYAHAPQGGL